MSSPEYSVERSMARHPAGRFADEMDEPTLDCWCGAHGAVEVQLQRLTDDAAWQTFVRHVRCLEHGLEALTVQLEAPHIVDRVVLMPLG